MQILTLTATDPMSHLAAFNIIDTTYAGVGQPMSTDQNDNLDGLNITVWTRNNSLFVVSAFLMSGDEPEILWMDDPADDSTSTCLLFVCICVGAK